MKKKLLPILLFIIFAGLSFLNQTFLNDESKFNNNSDSLKINFKKNFDEQKINSSNLKYKFAAELFPEAKLIKVNQKIIWKNETEFSANEIQFHLYPNAFKNSNTLYAKGRNLKINSENKSFINFKEIKVNGNSAELNYIQPDIAENKFDSTVASIKLEKSLQKNDSIIIELNYEVKILKGIRRFGYASGRNFFFAAQWFPKLGVFKNGNWITNQYHPFTNYFSDFADYEFEILVPENYKVAASGNLISKNNFEKLNIKNEIEIKAIEEESFVNSKRTFLISTFVYLTALSKLNFAQVKIQNKKPTKIPNNKKLPVAPPGAKNISHLKENCTACNLCVSACPTNVLQPSYLEYGFTGMMIPQMDYHKSFCNFDCKKCTEVCPTGALQTLNLPEKKLTQLGKAVFIKDNCIVHTEKTDCGACSEHCPTKAVKMVPYEKRFIPELHTEFCIGCGACEFACPVTPHKAIFVDGNYTHAKAKKPEVKKIEEKIDYKEEFPF